ncbi:MAG: hypothetical protein EA370_10735 [Wenzhouxiangella sp.]|nr:MAG: hypothetical protein EA370_10735 [Wenzhouxiangella sp.]
MTRLSISFKKLTLALAAAGALTLAAPVLAHPGHNMAERLAERLELTSEQQVQIQNLYEAHRDQMRALRNQEDGQRARGAWREGRLALNEEIRELLSDEQAEQFDAMQRRGYKGRGGQRHGGAFQALDLSDEQRSELRTLMRQQRGQERSDRAAMREQMREILTEEQRTRLDEAMQARGERRGDRGYGQRG